MDTQTPQVAPLRSGDLFGSSPAGMTDDPQYQAWVESMAKHCRCSSDRPCAGVLAGGLCDDIQDDPLGDDLCDGGTEGEW
jgi:hypothetical protein